MGRYLTLQTKVFSVFGTPEWQAEGVRTVPDNFTPPDTAEEFIRINIVPSNTGINIASLSGICLIEIYTAFGAGTSRINEIADKLDKYLLGKSIGVGSQTVQFGISTAAPRGQDKINPLLTRQDYTIPFNLFGVY